MSLSRNTLLDICDFIRQSSAQLFGKKFLDCRFVVAVYLQLATNKTDNKNELRFLVISKFRIFLLVGKSVANLKVERSFNVLALRSLQIVQTATQESALNICWEDRQQRPCSVLIRSALEEVDPAGVATQILSGLKHYFPDIRQSLPRFIQLTPPSLYSLFSHLPHSTPDLPCHNFRRSYVAECDLLEQPFRDEVLWDIERIYFTHDLHELRLEDFGHLGVKDHVAILACAQFSSYFTGILVDSIRMSAEHIEVLLNVVRRSHALKSLRLISCQLPKEFAAQLAQAIQHNHETLPLETLDLSGNSLDDKKAIAQLAQALTHLPSLKSLVLSDCCLTEKSIHHLAYGLYNGLGGGGGSAQQKFELRTLVLSKNLLSKEYQEVNNELVNFVSLCQSLRHLDLSHTGFHVDKLWSALKLGGLKMEHLKLAGCQVSAPKKHNKEESARIVRELFQSVVALRELDLGGTVLNADTLQHLLSGLANNHCVRELQLNLDGALTADKSCLEMLEKHITGCPIALLSLRDNSLEQEALRILPAVGRIKGLKCVDLGGNNFQALKNNPKKFSNTLAKVLQEIVALISNEELALEELSLADAHLGSQLSIVLNALGIARVNSLDFSNNDIANFGARLLAKALQLNNSLRVLALDRNQIGSDGFAELSNALKLNRTLTTLPFPVVDVADALQRADRQRVLSSLADIEMYLERNRRGGTEALSRSCAQRVCHRLNVASHLYDVNHNSEKKIAFHEIQKCLVGLGRAGDAGQQQSWVLEDAKTAALVDDVLARLAPAVVDAQSGLKSALEAGLLERNVQLASELKTTVDAADATKKAFRDDLEQLVKRYTCESAWSTLESRVNACLAAPKGFKLCGALSNLSSVENSFHSNVHQRSQNNGDLAHRPNSILDDSFHRQFGAISLASGETLSSGTADEEQVRMASLPKGSKLVHLAKNRPPPARRVKRARVETPPLAEMDAAEEEEMDDSPAPPSVESSPMRGVGTPETLIPATTPPPLAPKRKGLVAAPPKLPPKPDSPPTRQTTESATATTTSEPD